MGKTEKEKVIDFISLNLFLEVDQMFVFMFREREFKGSLRCADKEGSSQGL